FWQLITGEQAPMFGVFSSHEQQLIHDWIADDWLAEQSPKAARPPLRPAQGQRDDRHPQQRRADNDFDQEAQLLEQQLARLPSREARMRHLLPLLAPIRHHSHAGLLATRLFTGLFN
ncbi:MAG TPA: hypothetical protein DC050_19155, partial [Pseudomonas sp.]|nr:hypothetical protein [Pseudomonas sp.]